ncbi:metallophosphoesterase family protein [Rhizobium leguminosarum]|uniref:metallophosphoesterase family protein n=1 Tax=Rhizobium leguminosarum TaxID=384 RepID=UPI003F95D379
MATPTIALRFRDTTPSIDTIAAHKAILEKEGHVWWGWWKKDFEDGHESRFSALTGPINVLIADRSTKRMFKAEVSEWSFGDLAPNQIPLVPPYYREASKDVFAWFSLTSISVTSYDELIANSFGDHTIVFVDSIAPEKVEPELSKHSGKGSCIVHLSDLHFGPDYDFLLQGKQTAIGQSKKSLTACLVEDLRRLHLDQDIAAIIVTGDFVSAGDWNDEVRKNILDEFAAIRSALDLSAAQIIAVPGNHDIERYPKNAGVDAAAISVSNQANYKHEREFRTFVDELIGRGWKEPLNYVQRIRLETADVLLCILNSCTILATQWTEYGYVGQSGLDALSKMKDETPNRPTYKMMALHHHLLPVTGVAAPSEKGVTLTLDAPALLDAAQQVGVQIALHGHEHMPRLVRYQNIPFSDETAQTPLVVVSSGSTGVAHHRRPGNEPNTYCVFRLSEDNCHLWIRELRPDGKAGVSLFDKDLDVFPVSPVSPLLLEQTAD